jgi:CRISPR/Cas system-associated protein Csm6
MKEAIGKVSAIIPLTLETVDITSDRDLLRRYRTEIPVLFYNDSEIARHRIEESELREKLENLVNAENQKSGAGRSLS